MTTDPGQSVFHIIRCVAHHGMNDSHAQRGKGSLAAGELSAKIRLKRRA